MLIIGLTGGIGSGKSTVAELFREFGVPIFDADVEARRLVEPGQATLQALIREFGARILQPDGALDRAQLRSLAFSDSGLRQRLEAILHPPIRAALQRQIAAVHADYCIVVIPLLFESGQREWVDRVLVIDAPEERQISHTIARSGLDRATVQRIMAAQWPRAQRVAHADDIISNLGGFDDLRGPVARLHEDYLKQAKFNNNPAF